MWHEKYKKCLGIMICDEKIAQCIKYAPKNEIYPSKK